jgi:hypothetical protein
VCARFIPHLLQPDHKHKRATSSVEFVEMFDDDINVLGSIVTGDENWCFMYDPETKRQSATWLSPKKPKAQKVRTMLTAFFDAKGIVHHEFVSEKQTASGKF